MTLCIVSLIICCFLQVLNMRGGDVEQLATLAHRVQLCRKNANSIHQRLVNSKSLFEASTSICFL